MKASVRTTLLNELSITEDEYHVHISTHRGKIHVNITKQGQMILNDQIYLEELVNRLMNDTQ